MSQTPIVTQKKRQSQSPVDQIACFQLCNETQQLLKTLLHKDFFRLYLKYWNMKEFPFLNLLSATVPLYKMKNLKLLLIGFLLALNFCSLVSQEASLALTIYNDNFGMVKDTRTLTLDQGESSVYFTDVASTIQTETVMFKPKNASLGIQIFDQNFENNLANKYSLLKKYIDKNISIDVTQGKQSNNVPGKLLAYESGFLIETPSGVSMYESASAVHVEKLPEGLLTKPTLVWRVYSPGKTTAVCSISYRATGFSWKADYLMTLNEKESHVDFAGWVTIDNNSGKQYTNATLKLIAGDVNTVDNNQAYPMYAAKAVYMMDAAAAPSQSFQEKTFADYHMYTLSRPVYLNESSRKQIEFIPTSYNVAVDKYYAFTVTTGGYEQINIKAKGTIKFLNEKKNGLGIALPKGTIRVFKTDPADDSLEFIGQDSINHTPKNENITVKTGNAFDIVAKKVVVSRKNQPNGYDAKLKLEVTNRGDTEHSFRIELANGHGDNNIIEQTTNDVNAKWVKEGAHKFNLAFKLPGNKTHTIEWTETHRY